MNNIHDFPLRVHSVQDVECFVGVATSCPFPVRLEDGFHKVNGKSFMEMFCLNLTQQLQVVAECTEEEAEHFQTLVYRLLPLTE